MTLTTTDAQEDKRAEARLAMSGDEKTRFEDALTTMAKRKEALELEWIKLDDERKQLSEQLEIILDREKQAEEAEAKLEVEEAKLGMTKDKQEIEKKRWVIQDNRRDAEHEKWPIQEKLWGIEKLIQDHTLEYRKILATEEETKSKLEHIGLNSKTTNA